MEKSRIITEKIFAARKANGLWEVIPEGHKYYPECLHYVPNFRASLWTLLLLADLNCPASDERVKQPLQEVKNHLFDPAHGIYTLGKSHFPIPCLNGNLLFLDVYFNGKPGEKSLSLLAFFNRNQRFDDGIYTEPKNAYCSNKSCYGPHTCYWGVVKLFKGLSFIPEAYRNKDAIELRDKCLGFILKHKVCYSSNHYPRFISPKVDQLTFPNFYKSDFLEILWLLKREKIRHEDLSPALKLLKSKQQSDGSWNLERSMQSMAASVGVVGRFNPFVTCRAREVVVYYNNFF